MNDTQETTIWKGTPSAALDFWLNLSCLLVIPIPWALVRWVKRRNHVIELTSQRLRITTGIFSKLTEDLELYRVRDITFQQPFLLRMFGCGNLTLTTSDSSTPTVTLEGIPGVMAIRDELRGAVEKCRDRKRARVTEFGGSLDVDELDHGHGGGGGGGK
jgi:membrane protein YdbS with pleckstrin-like domain